MSMCLRQNLLQNTACAAPEKVRDLIKGGAHRCASTLPGFTFAMPYGMVKSC